MKSIFTTLLMFILLLAIASSNILNILSSKWIWIVAILSVIIMLIIAFKVTVIDSKKNKKEDSNAKNETSI